MVRELELWDCTWEPRRVVRGVEMSVPPSNEWKGTTCDWRGYEIVPELSYLWIERAWNPLREQEAWEEIVEGRVESVGTIVLSEQGWHLFCTTLAAGQNPMWLLGDAEARARQAGERFANKGWDTVSNRVVMGGWKEFKPPGARIKTWVPEFVADWFGGFDHVTEVADAMERIHVNCTWLAGEFYRTSLKYGPFYGDRARLGKEMATEEGIDDQQSGGSQGTNGDGERNEGSARDRESAKLEGTREDGKDSSIGESSGKAGGSKRGPQRNREGGNEMRTRPRNSAGVTSKKTKVSDASRKLAEIEKQTAEFKARLIEQMMAEDEEDPQGVGSREGHRIGQDEARYEGKDNNHKGTPSKKGKDKNEPPTEGTKSAMTPLAIDSSTSRLPATPKVIGVCDRLMSLRERVLGWFDPEGTPKTREKQRENKEGEGTSAAGEAGSSEGGLKRTVTTLTRALNKNQGYLADAKKKLTFDGANITEFLIDYENLAALLKWTEEEKMEHLGQHVSLSLGRDIMAIVTSSGSWKETRNEMMRKYLKAEKMATKAESAAVQRKNYATYNYFLRAFTLVALRIPGVTDRIMSKYLLRQFSEFDKDKIFVRKYKPVGKKAKPVWILVETSKEEAMEKEEEILRVIRERPATEGHRIPDEVADTMKIGVEGFLTAEETQLIRKACQEFYLAFAFKDHQKGRLDAKLVPPVRIHTVQHECWNDKGPAYEFGIAAEVTDLLRAKIDSFVVEPTASPYANKWFVFRKPNKTLRWTQDLQKLNAVTIRDAGSLPQADLLAESHAGRSIYSLVDLSSGYDQLPLDARDRPYTAMHTPVGQLQMQVTPMGFTNAVAEAQRRMLAVAGDMFPKKYEPYVDDNPVKGARYKDETEVEPGVRKFVRDHLQDIKGLLQRFLVYNITASEPNSILTVPEVTILGFRCGAYGRRPDPAKTDKISQWPTPLRTTTEVRAFLGVVGFWRIFIKGFAKIAEPIRAMIREGGTMDWTEDREEAARTLKDILSSDRVILAAPCFNDEVGRPFILETDGGPMAVGGVLIQKSEEGKERPIKFESRTLKSAERRYSQLKKEVLAILHCLKTFQAYLFGRRFILRIDSTNVVGALKNYKPIDPTVGRWIGFIWQFDYKVERIAGLRNRADGLSRVCITPEGIEDAEPIDAFLDYEGGNLVVDNEMADPTLTTGQLLIQTLEKGTPAVVAELREGPVTTVRRKEEKDSWRAEIGAREELMAMVVQGGRDTVMTLAETWAQKECQYLVNQTQEEQGTDQKEQEFFLIQMYEGVFKEIGLLLIGNKQPTEVSPKAREEVEKYVLRNGHLFKKEEGMMPRRVVCGRSRQLDVIQAMHDGLAGGHRSSKGTLAKIVPLYFWPGMAGMVATYCQTCLICQERSSIWVYEPLRPTWVLGPGHLVHLDLAVMPVSTDGFRYILDARDNLSGYVEAVALKKKTGKTVADWVEDFYLRHPSVHRFIVDNGTKFVNQEVLNRLKTLCVPIKITEPYHPEANAPVERGHRTLKNTIAKLAADNLGN
ncbi:hypothetical protein CBR_g22413 [Chara braunii]|uniref:Integrase catalytic domain-containing protein n=1 Tax=Chara braunii TaxID=69332 RepID=A0A388JUY5_CHABU|nr:hypothetical protein CBR_g22413 [Chara braunii]|eukprot:GBG61616.1 hypothetical protein CBR_g22413 [Chara braunii]